MHKNVIFSTTAEGIKWTSALCVLLFFLILFCSGPNSIAQDSTPAPTPARKADKVSTGGFTAPEKDLDFAKNSPTATATPPPQTISVGQFVVALKDDENIQSAVRGSQGFHKSSWVLEEGEVFKVVGFAKMDDSFWQREVQYFHDQPVPDDNALVVKSGPYLIRAPFSDFGFVRDLALARAKYDELVAKQEARAAAVLAARNAAFQQQATSQQQQEMDSQLSAIQAEQERIKQQMQSQQFQRQFQEQQRIMQEQMRQWGQR